ncbi:family 2B encapsulin nanocompartment shell protein [Streptacidiphilus rugosus]|uniref:family 2B encapsulin nanocompartment shell protein n=1 Tax=Streptacidiphilus rugosus TaxID=405783 RepID=UPI00055F6A7C|nr:family 2B encapsulin nanocompartment shell protein [Streptacidiphilus rugosus]
MTIEATESAAAVDGGGAPDQQSLSTQAARNLATTTKSAPQMQGISSRWLLKSLPWVNVAGGTYRVNRRLSLAVGRGRVGFVQNGADDVRIVPETLRELPALRDVEDTALLAELASRFTAREFRPGEILASEGSPIEEVFIVAHGRINRLGTGKYGDTHVVGVVTDGDHLGDEAVLTSDPLWLHTAQASTAGTVLVMPWSRAQELLDRSPVLREHIGRFVSEAGRATNTKGEAEVELSAGHEGEPELPTTFVDYDLAPREYELSITQTVLRIHSRVADLYNSPMNQTEEQLRLTIEEIREREEWELVNNREFGLLHNTAYDQRISTWSGPPTPDDLDELLSMRRGTELFLAHPKAIAAIFRECNKRGLYPDTVTRRGHQIPAWRGVPIYPCGKIPITAGRSSSILAMRLGEDNQGVVGLHQLGIPDEVEPGLNVRFMGIDERAIISYLVSAYYSVAILVPDAIGILENVDVAAPHA